MSSLCNWKIAWVSAVKELEGFGFVLENIATVLVDFFFFTIYFVSSPAVIFFEKQYCVYPVTVKDKLFLAVKQETSIGFDLETFNSNVFLSVR